MIESQANKTKNMELRNIMKQKLKTTNKKEWQRINSKINQERCKRNLQEKDNNSHKQIKIRRRATICLLFLRTIENIQILGFIL